MKRNEKNNLDYEREFLALAQIHKISTIQSALSMFEANIYESYLLKEDYEFTEDSGFEKAQRVVRELVAESHYDNGKRFNQVYEMCWNLIKDLVRDDKSYHINQKGV